MEKLRGIEILSRDMTYAFDMRYFATPIIVGAILMVLILVIYFIIKKYLIFYGVLLTLIAVCSILVSFYLTSLTMKVTSIKYTFNANTYGLEEVERLFGKNYHFNPKESNYTITIRK